MGSLAFGVCITSKSRTDCTLVEALPDAPMPVASYENDAILSYGTNAYGSFMQRTASTYIFFTTKIFTD
jgi:hypothetical protein